jgi:orotidine-5'-phosphate decarboxylase
METVTTSPICLALDTSDETELRHLAEMTADAVGVYKIGLTTIHSMGPRLIPALARLKPVFVDAKLHDIPAQVEGATRAIAEAGAAFVTVHATGGSEMVRAAVEASGEATSILAVTVLTSLNQEELTHIGIEGSVEDAVLRFGRLALDAGAHGLVCSPHEVARVRAEFGPSGDGGPLLVVPGIRPTGAVDGDQKRTMGPREAIDAGADLIVVGRPITEAEDPEAAARSILDEVNS